MNGFTEQIGVIKSRGQVNSREESHYHEREGGIVRRFWGIKSSPRREFQASCQRECVSSSEYYYSPFSTSSSSSFSFLLVSCFLCFASFHPGCRLPFDSLVGEFVHPSILKLQNAMSLTPSAASSHDLKDNTNISLRDSMTRRNGKTLFTSSGELAYT